MNWKPIVTTTIAAAALLSLSACRIQTQDGENGKNKNVKIDTPFGGVHVTTDKTGAADIGLPAYPGAQVFHEKNDSNGSADVHLGFGKWQLRVKAVEYSSSDPEDKVIAFYQKALGRYGDVITCKGETPVGTPTVTREGLSCKSSEKNSQVNVSDSNDHLSLKAGSPQHQHIVSIKTPHDNQTRFALVALDLPKEIDSKGVGETN